MLSFSVILQTEINELRSDGKFEEARVRNEHLAELKDLEFKQAQDEINARHE